MIGTLKTKLLKFCHKLELKKKGFNMRPGVVNSAAVGIISVALLLRFAASLVPEAQAAAGNLSADASDAPLISLFSRTGIVILLLMAALILAVVAGTVGGRRR